MSRPKRRLVLAMTLVAVLGVAGCSWDAEAPPKTRTSSTTRTASLPTTRPTTAPPVTRTLDLAAYRSRPCDLLKPEQRAFFSSPVYEHTDVIDYCAWSNDRWKSGLTVLPMINADHFNEIFQPGYYRKWLIFEQRTVAGQPAVVVTDSPNPRYCDVVVATGPKDSFEVHQDSGTLDEDSCVRAVEWAEKVVRNLGG